MTRLLQPHKDVISEVVLISLTSICFLYMFPESFIVQNFFLLNPILVGGRGQISLRILVEFFIGVPRERLLL